MEQRKETQVEAGSATTTTSANADITTGKGSDGEVDVRARVDMAATATALARESPGTDHALAVAQQSSSVPLAEAAGQQHQQSSSEHVMNRNQRVDARRVDLERGAVRLTDKYLLKEVRKLRRVSDLRKVEFCEHNNFFRAEYGDDVELIYEVLPPHECIEAMFVMQQLIH